MMTSKKKLIIIASVLLIMILGAVFILVGLKNEADKISLNTLSDTGKIVAVLEKPFFLERAATPSTGYQWQADFDTKTVKLIGTTFSEAKDPNIVGGEVIQTFEFQPLEKGETTVKLRYVRPWEDTAPAQIEEFLIVIK